MRKSIAKVAKAQSVIEYFLNYIWLILILTVVMAFLIYSGIFNPDFLAPSVCLFSPGMLCSNFTLSNNGILTIGIRQLLSAPINVIAVGCGTDIATAHMSPPQVAGGSIVVPNGGNYLFDVQCYSDGGAAFAGKMGQAYRGYLFINYTPQGGTQRTVLARLIVKVSHMLGTSTTIATTSIPQGYTQFNDIGWTVSNDPVQHGQYQALNSVVSGGVPPYTYTFLVYNAEGSLVDTLVRSGISSTSNAYAFPENPAWGHGLFMANAVVTDSESTPASVTNTLTYTVEMTSVVGPSPVMEIAPPVGYYVGGVIGSSEVLLDSGYGSYICDGAGYNWDFNTSWADDVGLAYVHSGANPDELCVANLTVTDDSYKGQSISGIGVSSTGSPELIYGEAFQENDIYENADFGSYFMTSSPDSFVVLSVACGGFSPCDPVNFPSECSKAAVENEAYWTNGTTLLAVCHGMPQSEYMINGMFDYGVGGNVTVSAYEWPAASSNTAEAGQTIVLVANVVDPGSGIASYQWYNDTNGTAINAIANPTAATNALEMTASRTGSFSYHIVATGTNGNPGASNSFAVEVYNALSIVSPLPDITVGYGQTYEFSVNAVGGVGPLEYSWSTGFESAWPDCQSGGPNCTINATWNYVDNVSVTVYDPYSHGRGGASAVSRSVVTISPDLTSTTVTSTSTTSTTTIRNAPPHGPTTTSTTSTSTFSTALYCIGGTGDSADGHQVYYSPLTPGTGALGLWKQSYAYPLVLDYGSCVSASNAVYCIGGYDASADAYTEAVYYASVMSNNVLGPWSATSQYPFNVLESPACVANPEYVYCIGGFSDMPPSNYYIHNEIYRAQIMPDKALGTWTYVNDFPHNLLSGSPICTASATHIYCLATSVYASHQIFYSQIMSDGSLGTWAQTLSYPGPSWIWPACTANDKAVYCIGTAFNPELPRHVFSKDGAVLPQNGTGAVLFDSGAGYCSSGALYCRGTAYFDGSGVSPVYYAPIVSNGALGTWSLTSFYPLPAQNIGCVASPNAVYCAGGEIVDDGYRTNQSYYASVLFNGALGAWHSAKNLTVGVLGTSCILAPTTSTTSVSTTSTTIAYGMRYMSMVNQTGTRAWSDMSVYQEGGGYNHWCEAASSYSGLDPLNWYESWGDSNYASVDGSGVQFGLHMCNTTSSVHDLAVQEMNVYISHPYFGHTWYGYSVEGDSASYTTSMSYTYNVIFGPPNSPVAVAIMVACGEWSCTLDMPSSCVKTAHATDSYGFENISIITCDQRSGDTAYTINANLTHRGTAAIEVFQFPYGWWDYYNVTSAPSTTTTTSTSTTSTSVTSVTSTTTVSSTVINNIYCVGNDGRRSGSLTYYASLLSGGRIGSWNYGGAFPEGNPVTCATSEAYIYCVSGSDMYSAQISASGIGSWSGPYSVPISSQSCSAYNGYLYCVGGTSVEYAQISGGSPGAWTAGPGYPVPLTEAGCSVSYGYLYCVGSSSSPTEQEVYFAALHPDGSMSGWMTATSYPHNFYSAGCSNYEGYAYCVGTGDYGGSDLGFVAYYAPLGSDGDIEWIPTNAYAYPNPTFFLNAPCVTYSGYLYCIGDDTMPSTAVFTAPVGYDGIGKWTMHSDASFPIPSYSTTCVGPASGGGYLGDGGVNNGEWAEDS